MIPSVINVLFPSFFSSFLSLHSCFMLCLLIFEFHLTITSFSLSPVYSNEAHPPTLGILHLSLPLLHHEHCSSLTCGPWATVPHGHFHHTRHPNRGPGQLHLSRCPSQPGPGPSDPGWGLLAWPWPRPRHCYWGSTSPGPGQLQEVRNQPWWWGGESNVWFLMFFSLYLIVTVSLLLTFWISTINFYISEILDSFTSNVTKESWVEDI